MSKMKAVVAYAPGDLRMMDVERPEAGPHDVLVKVTHCGICGTDVSIADGTLNLGESAKAVYPVYLGHEWAGVVVEAGSKIKKLKVGDRVLGDSGVSCDFCDDCAHGKECSEGRAIGTVNNHWHGGMAEYILMPEWNTHRIPDSVPLDEAALVEPTSIGMCGLMETPVGPGRNILVVGTGPISLGGMACAIGMGAGKVMLAGRKDAKLAIGREMGANVLINMEKENLREAVLRETDGIGADVILDSTGAAELFNEIVMSMRGGGYMVIPGFYERTIPEVAIDNIVSRGCRIVGAAGVAELNVRILNMMEYGRIKLGPMITDRFPFEQALDAFKAIKERNDRRIKIMLEF